MAQFDLFQEESSEPFSLPALNYGPVKMAIGQIRAQLRPAAEIELLPDGQIRISPRTLVPVYKHPEGERYAVVHRRNVTRPDDIDGLLLRDDLGKLSWLSHRLIDEIENAGKVDGWDTALAARAEAIWDGMFRFRTEISNDDGSVDPGNEGLRPPQIGALHAIGAHWSLYSQPATIVMPTGTGKTETMLSVQTAFLRKPLLVVVPSDALRAQTVRKFLTLGLLRKLGVLTQHAGNPIVGIVTKVPKSISDLEIFERCNVIVGTMSSLAGPGAETLGPEVAKRVGALIVDEAHHIGADTWSAFRDAFAGKPVLQFTATPFRRDGKLVDGQVIYNYPLKRAQQDGYFKPITFEPVYEPNLDQADFVIAEAAIAQLREDLGNKLNHLMMARCSTIERASAVFEVYRKLAPDLNPLLVHSRQASTCAVMVIDIMRPSLARAWPRPTADGDRSWCKSSTCRGYGDAGYEAMIGERIDHDPQIAVDGRKLETEIVTHLERLAGVLAAVGLTGPGLVSIAFRGVEDVELTRARGGGRRIRKPELFLPELCVDDLSAPMQPLLREQFNILWQASGWADGSPSFS